MEENKRDSIAQMDFRRVELRVITNMWDRVAEALHVSREFVKNTTYRMMYGDGGDVDPWVAYLIREELRYYG